MPIKKDIIYPIFLECCEYTKDEFWRSIFEDLAYGITPQGTFISKGSLCCSYKRKQFSYTIQRKEPQIKNRILDYLNFIFLENLSIEYLVEMQLI